MKPYVDALGSHTPQSEPLPGSNQVPNHAGGYTYAVTPWQQLDRFLVLGATGGTYYAGERTHIKENADAVRACLALDGPRTVRAAAEVSHAGRAPSNDPAIVVLALAAASADRATRAAAYEAIPRICRIPTHLFHFLALAVGRNPARLRGWSGGLRRAVARWYGDAPVDRLAYHLAKYPSRDKWAHRDVLRLAHPDTLDPARSALYRYAAAGMLGLAEREIGRPGKDDIRRYPEVGMLPDVIVHTERLRAMTGELTKAQEREIVSAIVAHGLTREMLPTQALASVAVWEALLDKMPIEAMIRNVPTMTRVGLLQPLSAATTTVTARLRDQQRLIDKRVHPVKLLVAQKVYASGKSTKGSSTWTPVQTVVDALDEAFYLAFGAVRSTGQNVMLALDVSGSMGAAIAGLPLTCREAAAAMALVTANVEPNRLIVGFTSGSARSNWGLGPTALKDLAISSRQRLSDVVAYLGSLPFGGTDCSLPMLYAQERKIDVDGIAIYTDDQTWAGTIHASQALKQYRQARGRATKLAVVGMTATRFSIADPNDGGMLDFVGFDTATPDAIGAFLQGEA